MCQNEVLRHARLLHFPDVPKTWLRVDSVTYLANLSNCSILTFSKPDFTQHFGYEAHGHALGTLFDFIFIIKVDEKGHQQSMHDAGRQVSWIIYAF